MRSLIDGGWCSVLYGVPSMLEPLGGPRECVSDALVKVRFAVHDSDADRSLGRRTDKRRRNPPWVPDIALGHGRECNPQIID